MMRFPISLLIPILFGDLLSAQNLFNFREACLLGSRMWRSGADYSTRNSQPIGRYYSAALPNKPDPGDPQVYRDERWLLLLQETDDIRRTGALALAEKQYFQILSKIKQIQGPNAIDVGWMLDRIGDFYLETRDFEKAYRTFSDAVEIRRSNIQTLGQDSTQATKLTTCRAHLVKLLVILGRLDFAKGDLSRATQELNEAVTTGNQYPRLNDGLDAVYFDSLLLENQEKWEAAEALWQQALKIREKMTVSDPFWDLMKEFAAFYARRGDYKTAATIVNRVQSETAGKHLKRSIRIAREGTYYDDGDVYFLLYSSESEVAMNEILAVDRWLSMGPEAAAPFLAARPMREPPNEERVLYTRGSDSQRARFLSFLGQRAYLHMSILLDGTPSPESVESAYAAIQPLKGFYLDSLAAITSLAQEDRKNSPSIMLDDLATERARHAHFFVAAALDGKPFNNFEFAASEAAEQAVSEGLAYSKKDLTNIPLTGNPSNWVPDGAALIDFIAWERTSRSSPTITHREYGAFVLRKDQPIKFVQLGPAPAIEADVKALESIAVGSGVRGFLLNSNLPQTETEQTNQRLRHLYQEVISPLAGSLAGVNRLLIVPDGQLALAPIGAFIDKQGEFLLQHHTVSYLQSWRSLIPKQPSEAEITPPVVIANPDFNAVLFKSNGSVTAPGRPQFGALPASALEADDVKNALHIPPDRVLTGPAAREEAVRSLDAPQILHFATHSVPNLEWKIPSPAYDLFDYPKSLATQDPLMQSIIVLAGGNRPQAGPEDGILTGLEISSLRLSGTKLVVLSTCEAGQGEPVDGQGVLGLRAAFTIAGAQGLVMSLWPINDQAGRRFMQFFYSHLDAGPAAAVRLAQLDMVAKTEYKEPKYWAGYAYSGVP